MVVGHVPAPIEHTGREKQPVSSERGPNAPGREAAGKECLFLSGCLQRRTRWRTMDDQRAGCHIAKPSTRRVDETNEHPESSDARKKVDRPNQIANEGGPDPHSTPIIPDDL